MCSRNTSISQRWKAISFKFVPGSTAEYFYYELYIYDIICVPFHGSQENYFRVCIANVDTYFTCEIPHVKCVENYTRKKQ